jgi:hypothetical protein
MPTVRKTLGNESHKQLFGMYSLMHLPNEQLHGP